MLLWLLVAAPLPADVWSVGPDGKSCVQLDERLAAELATWKVDPESSAPAEGVYGRVNPTDDRQLVLLFRSKAVCERMVWAVGEERKANRPSRSLDDKQVRDEVEAIAARDLEKLWSQLSARDKKAIYADARRLFAGDAHKVRVRKRIAVLAHQKRPSRSDRARLALWKRLYRVVFAEVYEPKAVE